MIPTMVYNQHMDRLDAIEARANAATEGPWRWTDELRQRLVTGDNPDDLTDARELIRCAALMHPGRADATFIAHARTDVPALVVAIRAVLELCEEADGTPFIGGYLHSDEVRGVLRDALQSPNRDNGPE